MNIELSVIGRLGSRNSAALFLLGVALLWLAYAAGLFGVWISSDEYGHGPLVLLVLAYLVYARRHTLRMRAAPGAIVLFALLPVLSFLLGSLIGSPQLQMYAVWLFLVLTTAAFGGVPLLIQLAVPLLIAFMIIPLPYGLESALTARLQLLSSEIGVWFIRLLGGVVHLQGNVIDMGGIKLLVAEACAGLRYLYPLMSLGALAGYLLRAPVWIRWTVFLSTIPITVLMNSLRIGATGILVDRWGLEHTEGFLHFFEGWVVFIVALIALLLLAQFLLRLQPGAPKLLDALSLDPKVSGTVAAKPTSPSASVLAAVAVAAVFAASVGPFLAARQEILPAHRPLVEFPVQLGTWSSSEYRLPPSIESVAGATEYYYADYFSSAGQVNLYVSYYQTQREGQIPHSPKVCIPGDGWTIESNQPLRLDVNDGHPVNAIRLLIRKGDKTMIAYYWLKQGASTFSDEVLAKLALVRSSVAERRTDGALVRLVAEVKPNETIDAVDRRLAGFARELSPVLPLFVPD